MRLFQHEKEQEATLYAEQDVQEKNLVAKPLSCGPVYVYFRFTDWLDLKQEGDTGSGRFDTLPTLQFMFAHDKAEGLVKCLSLDLTGL